MPPINEWFEKKYVPGPRETVGAERQAELSALQAQALGKADTPPGIEDLHFALVAEVGLDIIVDRLGYLSGNRPRALRTAKRFRPLGVHLPAGADCAVDFGDKINLVFADFVRLRLSAGLLVFSGKTFLKMMPERQRWQEGGRDV